MGIGDETPKASIAEGVLERNARVISSSIRLLGLACEPGGLLTRYGSRLVDPGQILSALSDQGLKARPICCASEELILLPSPTLAVLEGGQLIALVHGDDRSQLCTIDDKGRRVPVGEDFQSAWTGEVILIQVAQTLGAKRRIGLSWLLKSAQQHRTIYRDILVGSFVIQFLGLAAPIISQVVIDKVLVHRSLATLDVLMIALCAVIAFEAGFNILRNYLLNHTAARADSEMGARLMAHFMDLPALYFLSHKAGDSVSRIREIESLRRLLTGPAIAIVIDSAFAIVFVVAMFMYSTTLGLIVLAGVPFYLAVTLLFRRPIKERMEEKTRFTADSQSFIQERISGIETVKSLSIENQCNRQWDDMNAQAAQASFRAANASSIATQLHQLVGRIVLAATLWVGAKLVINGSLTVGEMIAFNMLSARANAPIMRLVQIWHEFQQAAISLARLGDILNAPRETNGRRSGMAATVKGQIALKNVNFRYSVDGPQILNGISTQIPAGQVLGIVGPSGSGKSTLAKLLQRMYFPQGGQIAFDGADVGLFDPVALRRQVGVVLQDALLFSGSIRENIAAVDPTVDLRKVIAAASLAGAHEFITALPNGYDTQIHERGSNLSGGQRQRIALARALITNPRVLILDEATSALDVESEAAIQRNMTRITQGRTVIIIAHRLSALRHAQRILTVESGRIVEDGAPADLAKRSGYYSSMLRHQGNLTAEHAA